MWAAGLNVRRPCPWRCRAVRTGAGASAALHSTLAGALGSRESSTPRAALVYTAETEQCLGRTNKENLYMRDGGAHNLMVAVLPLGLLISGKPEAQVSGGVPAVVAELRQCGSL